jgi:hypothetical protein
VEVYDLALDPSHHAAENEKKVAEEAALQKRMEDQV